MKRLPRLGFSALLLAVLALAARAQTTYYWSGIGTGWQGQVTPPSDGSAIFYLGSGAINQSVPFTGNFNLNSIVLDTGNSDAGYQVTAASPVVLTVGSAIISTGNGSGRLQFSSNIDLSLAGSVTFSASNSSIVVPGHISGSASLSLVSSSTNGGAFIFNNTDTGNSYTGGTTFAGVATSTTVAAFWNSSPFGTGPLTIDSSTQLIAHNTVTLANAVSFSTVTANDPILFKSWDAPLTLSGPVSLANNTTIVAQPSQHGVATSDNTGIFPTPGAGLRNPIVFTGAISESGSRSLTVSGQGIVILDPASGSNAYTGGTTVNGGSLIFGNNNAIPSAGSILVNGGGYVGFGDTSSGNFAAQIGHISLTSGGAVGVDTLPGNSMITYADPIDLHLFTNSTIRIGTATSAILTGPITPQGNDYQFGNGGGTLFVQSSLGDISGASNLTLTDTANGTLTAPLKLYIQSTPGYTGTTTATNGIIIFDSGGLPTGKFTAAGLSTNTGASYIGVTNAVDTTPNLFVSNFDQANTWGIVGFDTHGGGSHDFGGVNLSSLNNGVYLGTATSATFSTTITPTLDNILRLTAANGGTLTINSTLTDSGSPLALALGTPATPEAYSNGTIVLNGTNTYTGGTTIKSIGTGITLQLGNANALGTGALTLPQDVSAGLQTAGSFTVSNPIIFQTPVDNTHAAGSLFLTGSNYFELAGAINGPGSLNIGAPVSLAGDNHLFTGDINFVSGNSLYLNSNTAAGAGTVRFNGTNSYLVVGSATTAPILYGVESGNGPFTGYIQVNNNTVLTFDTSNPNSGSTFAGTIGYEGPVSASVIVTATTSGNALYLSGTSNYTGGTTITNHGAVGIGNPNALGTGMVTLNAPNGALAVNNGITFSNPLTFTSGALAGFGTFAPSNLPTITIDTGKSAMPGLYALGSHDLTGTLTFGSNAVFANGGQYLWSLQDASRTDGYSLLNISGNLNIAATAGGFTLDVLTIDATNHLGFANLTVGQPYTFTILHSTGGITGFNAADFTVDAHLFQNGTLASTNFVLTADANNIYLSFTPVPEPSTYALMGLGLSVLVLPVLRRRRA